MSGGLPSGGGNSGGSVTVTNFPTTQPISAASLPLPTGAAQDATLTGGTQVTQVSSLPPLPAGSNAIGTVGVTQGGSALSATNPVPTQPSIGNAAVSASNPLPAQLSQGGAVLATGNPLPVSEASLRGTLNAATSISANSALNVVPQEPLNSYTITGTGALSVIDTSGFAHLLIQPEFAAGTYASLQFSNDQTTWQSATNLIAPYNDSVATAISGSQLFSCKVQGRYARINCTTYVAGTNTITVQLKTAPLTEFVSSALLAVPQGGATKTKVNSAASTNATLISAGTHQLYGYAFYNSTATVCFIHFYDNATSPTVGTTVPAFTVQVPANGSAVAPFDIGMAFTNGLAYSITGGYADTDATAVAAGSCFGVITWK